eukprot:UN10383
MKKCFENISKVEFDKNMKITAMVSAKGEVVPFQTPIDPSASQVEIWLGQLEKEMKVTMKSKLNESYKRYLEMDRVDWLKESYGQCVMTMTQVVWTQEVEKIFGP